LIIVLATEGTEDTEMIEKRTVFVLGAGASCPYGYPSGAQLRRQICLEGGDYLNYLNKAYPNDVERHQRWESFQAFGDKFFKSSTESIDLFMARNPHFARDGKYIIAFKMFAAEPKSHFCEQAVEGQDWYSYLIRRLTKGVVSQEELCALPWEMVAFITFNYDRSLEYFLHESLRNSFLNLPEHELFALLKRITIIHVYGRIAQLQWQNPADCVDYASQMRESLLQKAATSIKTIYEEKESPELAEAHKLLESAERIFFLGFGYAPENMEVLNLPDLIPPGCEVYGTAFGMMAKEVEDILHRVRSGRKPDPNIHTDPSETTIKSWDCLMMLRYYL
jgi:hypothetical protein